MWLKLKGQKVSVEHQECCGDLLSPDKGLRCLTEQQVSDYWRDGFVQLSGICSLEEVESWRQESRRIWQEQDICQANMRIQWRENLAGEWVADRIDPLLDLSELFSRLASEPRFLNIVADLLGQASSLFKAKLISKWPGTRGYGLHQDYNYWRFVENLSAHQMLTLVIALDKCDPDSGGLELFPGLHERLILSDKDDEQDINENQIDTESGVIAEMSPGDILLFHSLAPHRSGANHSSSNRECLFFSYMCGDSSALYQNYYEQRSTSWMRPWEQDKA